jgi:predicted transcriptional regulator/adenylate kinase
MANGEAVLLSIHAEHAIKILSGEKRIEFRRVWAARKVTKIVIYVTAPLKKIVAIARVKHVHKGSPTAIWMAAKDIGGGLSRDSVRGYFEGKAEGFGVELKCVERFPKYLDPHLFFSNFRPPQSFAYVSPEVLASLENELEGQRATLRGRVLFVGGAHGVGKTSICQQYASTHGVIHKSAGQLIKEARGLRSSELSKAVSDIDGNQRLLVDAVGRVRSSANTLVLDGHFSVFDANYKPTPIPTAVFSVLSIDGVIVVVDSPHAIALRIAGRDGLRIASEDIRALQTSEVQRGMQVARELCVPFAQVKFGATESFELAAETFTK